MDLKLWIKAVRAKFLSASVIPVLLGTLVAWSSYGNINIFIFVATLIGVVSIHLAANLSNDYFDFRSGADNLNDSGSEFSGGSRVIQEDLLSPKKILYVSYGLFILGLVIGGFLAFLTESFKILLLGVIGVFIGYFYTADPLKLSYKGFAEVSNILIFGPMIGLGTYYVQVQSLNYEIIIVSIIPGILLGLVLIINEFPDFKSDKRVGKKTLVVRFGRKKSKWIFIGLLISIYIYQIIWAILGFLPILTLISLITIPLMWKMFIIIRNENLNFEKFQKLSKYMIQLHSLYGLFLIFGYIGNLIV